jgi:hypothetical protein
MPFLIIITLAAIQPGTDGLKTVLARHEIDPSL